MNTLWQDVRYGLRMLARNPGFAVVVLVILAVGIGANTAIFSVVNAVMLRPLPYKDADRIVTIQEQGFPWKQGFRHRPNFFYLQEHNTVFESLAGVCFRGSYVTGIEKPHEARVCDVTWNMFSLLGVQPIVGRGFLQADEAPSAERVAVLSHAFWIEHFGGSEDAIGRSMGLTRSRLKSDYTTAFDQENYTIVGVMPPGFDFPFARRVPFWTTMVHMGESEELFPLPITARGKLKEGVTPARANAELALLVNRASQTDADVLADGGMVRVRRLLDGIVEGYRRLPLLILGAAGFVLLIACSNVANLFLARAMVRRREMAMRLALGASRGRVMRQMLTESLLVSVAAGVLGLMLTGFTVKGLVRLCPSDIPRLQETRVDVTVLAFTLGASVLTGLVFGMMPAWRASEMRVSDTLKQGISQTTCLRRWRGLHGGLVVSQLGLSLILLVGAALLIRSLIALNGMDLGFRPENLLTMELHLPKAKYQEDNLRRIFFDQLLKQLRALPQVRSAGVVYHTENLTEPEMDMGFTVIGQTNPDHEHSAPMVSVSPGFFKTMGIELLSGQRFTDHPEGPTGIIIDRTLAERHFPGTDPVGQVLLADGLSKMRIEGIVETMRNFMTPVPTRGVIYRKGDGFMGFGVFVVRTEGDSKSLIPAIRTHVARMETDQVIRTIEPMAAALSRMLAPRRFVMILLGLFAGIALTLATVGVYGLLQYSTTQQTHDIGIRIALGARRINVLRVVLGQGLKLTLLGITIGLVGALALTRVLSSLLYDVTPTDPLTLVCVTFILTFIALLASYIPACRAAKVDPMEALRYE